MKRIILCAVFGLGAMLLAGCHSQNYEGNDPNVAMTNAAPAQPRGANQAPYDQPFNYGAPTEPIPQTRP